MKKILLVDDDALVLELYRKKLANSGFEVQTALDGLEAVKTLGSYTPDFVVLDLMMPKFSGLDVLKFMRAKPSLAKVPVAVLTNAFMSEQSRAVSAMGVTRAITKGECTPSKMIEIVSQALGVEVKTAPAKSTAVTEIPVGRDEAREQFLSSVPAEFTDLKSVSQEFAQDPAAANRSGNLSEFRRQMHHLAGAAAAANCHNIALMSGALEALLFELTDKPQFINPSTSRTVTASVEFLGALVEDAQNVRRAEPASGEVLVVDDDPLANRIALAALSRARLRARAAETPDAALQMLMQSPFELVLLDVEMPQMSGYDLCRKVRMIPGYEKTPVIYVTVHADFESRAKSIVAGGNDLIAKPILPIELAVKAVTHLIRGRLALGATEIS